MSISIEFDPVSFQKAQRNLKALRGFSGQKRSVRDAAAKALRHTRKAAKNLAPVAKRSYTDYTGRVKKPGTLKRSIGVKKARNAPVALVGPRTGSRQRNDGWYAHFHEDGTKTGIRPKRFMKRAWNQSKSKVFATYRQELDASFDKYAKRALRR